MEHVDIPPGEIHAPHNWRVASAAARAALPVTAAELGMYAWQQDDDTEWMLISAAPVQWQQRGGSAGGALTAANRLSEFAGDTAAQAAAQANLGLGAVDLTAYYTLAKS